MLQASCTHISSLTHRRQRVERVELNVGRRVRWHDSLLIDATVNVVHDLVARGRCDCRQARRTQRPLAAAADGRQQLPQLAAGRCHCC